MEVFGILFDGLFAAFKVLFLLIWEIFKWPIIIIGIVVAIIFIVFLIYHIIKGAISK